MKNFIVVHEQTDPKQPNVTTKYLINPLSGEKVKMDFYNN